MLLGSMWLLFFWLLLFEALCMLEGENELKVKIAHCTDKVCRYLLEFLDYPALYKV